MKTTISTFKPQASYPEQAIVLIFDLEGFSKFFSQPDVQDYVPKFLNIIFEAIEIIIDGGEAYWELGTDKKPKKLPGIPKHIHSKFLGDGALYIWRHKDFTHSNMLYLVNKLWNLKLHFNLVVKRAADEIPVRDIPSNIRFGVSAGSVYKLTYVNSNKEEYIGYSINLASRLQNYCRQIGLIISGRLNIKASELEKNRYLKLVATKIKGFPQEIVFVDKSDYTNLSEEIKADLFEPV